MNTPTPRTDDVYLEHRYWANEDEATEAIEDLRDLARKLERELDAERQKVRALREACCEIERYAIEGSENERLLRAALAATEDKP